MIFIIEPEIDFVTITVVVGSLYQKKWHPPIIIGTAFHQFEDFFIIFLLQDPLFVEIPKLEFKKVDFAKETSLSKYIEKLERLCNNHQFEVL